MAFKGVIFDIKRYAIHDGPGIRTTVFFKGCPLKCRWCHNPEGIFNAKELMFFEYKCIHCQTCAHACPVGLFTFEKNIPTINRQSCSYCGICSDVCPTEALTLVGRDVTIEEVIEEVEKDTLYYDKSGGGVTFSGGDPLFQHEFFREVLIECKKRDIHATLDTCGFTSKEIFASILDYVDLFLFDLKLADDEEHKKYTGVSNKLIEDNLRMLIDKGRGKDDILRFPVIPEITDTEKNIDDLVEFVSSLTGINEIDLLPFHDVSEKYKRLGKEYKMTVQEAPSPVKLEYIKQKFEAIGLYVKV
jgi:pyruvate formate lyase activating enzyme